MSKENNNGGGKMFAGLLLGAIAGGIAGLLFAPKSGKETREDLKKEADRLKGELEVWSEKAGEKADEIKAELEKKLKETKEKLNNFNKEDVDLGV